MGISLTNKLLNKVDEFIHNLSFEETTEDFIEWHEEQNLYYLNLEYYIEWMLMDFILTNEMGFFGNYYLGRKNNEDKYLTFNDIEGVKRYLILGIESIFKKLFKATIEVLDGDDEDDDYYI